MQPQEAHPSAETSHVTYRSPKSVADMWCFITSQDGGCPPSWICGAHFGTTHEE